MLISPRKTWHNLRCVSLAFIATLFGSESNRRVEKVYACGGGVRNQALMRELASALAEVSLQKKSAWRAHRQDGWRPSL